MYISTYMYSLSLHHCKISFSQEGLLSFYSFHDEPKILLSYYEIRSKSSRIFFKPFFGWVNWYFHAGRSVGWVSSLLILFCQPVLLISLCNLLNLWIPNRSGDYPRRANSIGIHALTNDSNNLCCTESITLITISNVYPGVYALGHY